MAENNKAIIDFHTHILPEIDDGSKSIGMTLAMLHEMKQQGVTHIAATPHFYAQEQSVDEFLIKRRSSYSRLMLKVQAENLTVPYIHLGAECAFFPAISKIEKLEELCIEGTNLLLLEMPFAPWSTKTLKEVEQILRRGITPIIAHIERFYGYPDNKAKIKELMQMPVYIQVNAEALLDWKSRRRALKLFKSGEAKLLASDAHNMASRKPNLMEGRAVIEKKLGAEMLDQIDAVSTRLLGV